MSTTRQNAILLVLLLASTLLLMSGSVRNTGGSTPLRSWLARITGPLVDAAGTIGGGVRSMVAGSGDVWTAHARNRRLETEVARLRAELRASREAQLENDRLRRMLEMRENLAPASIGASVVTVRLGGQSRLIVVDRGSAHGVTVNLPVLAWGGAVGRVVDVDATHAVVRLLTDPNSGVAGVVQRSRAQGLVVGQGTDVLDMLYVPRFSDVMHGDRVVTSGLDGVFPRGFGIGRVSAVREVPDGSQRIQVVPETDLRSLEEVLIVLEPVAGEVLEEPAGEETP